MEPNCTVLVPLVDGFEEVEAVTIVDVLRRGGVDVVTAALGSSLEVSGAHSMTLHADAFFKEVAADDYAAIVLPGGPGTSEMRANEALLERLREQKEANRLIAAICAAPLVLMDAGVLDPDQHVTCYPTCQMELDRACAAVPVVEDGLIITGQAPGAALLFALIVLKTLAGEDVAKRVANGLVTHIF